MVRKAVNIYSVERLYHVFTLCVWKLRLPKKGNGHTASNRITKRYPCRVLWRSHRMTTNEKVARRKLSLLELAKELNNVSKACKLIGYSRQQFYEIRRNYQTYGAEG